MHLLIKLRDEWKVGDRIGGGGFGQVHAAVSAHGAKVALKLVPKAPGAQRELLFVDLAGARNVVPVIDSGETDDHWVMVMPMADSSLRQRLDRVGGPLEMGELSAVLADTAAALADLDGRVVHRDVKPENILLLDGRWCLADFGISRYAEATTAVDTQKHAMSVPYAAPERWRGERATTSTDMYSVGVVAFEMLTGRRPFSGPAMHDFRMQHLHQAPPEPPSGPTSLKALVGECLFKAPEARPSPSNFLARIERLRHTALSPGLARLEEANLAYVGRIGNAARIASQQRSEAERRQDLVRGAAATFARMGDELRSSLSAAAPAAQIQADREGGWAIYLGPALLKLQPFAVTGDNPWSPWSVPVFDVVAHASLAVSFPTDRYGYSGRGHSLWFCDAREAGRYGWFETAFMNSAFSQRRSPLNPFALSPGPEAAKALGTGLTEFDVAWPFEPLVAGDIDGFVGRWADWFGRASLGCLGHPQSMPERRPEGSWRCT